MTRKQRRRQEQGTTRSSKWTVVVKVAEHRNILKLIYAKRDIRSNIKRKKNLNIHASWEQHKLLSES